MKVPKDLKYTQTHEWLRKEEDFSVLGITDHAQSELGDIVYIELPNPGRYLQKDEVFGTVESVKTVSDLYAPFAAEVVEVNESLHSRPELVNSDPYGGGWMIRLKPAEENRADFLDADAYQAFMAQ